MQMIRRQPYALIVLMLAVFLVCSAFNGCAAQRAAETVEQRAGALIGDFNIFQSAALHIGADASVPSEVRAKVVNAAVALKPAVDSMDELLRSYIAIKAELDAAPDAEAKTRAQEKLEVASTRLSGWITDLAPKIAALRATIQGALK
jgi:hypothetical protein